MTNHPTPYRNHSYAMMFEVFRRNGIDFDVMFMAWTERGRWWKFRPSDLHYPSHVYRGIHPFVGGFTVHANPGLLWDLATENKDIAIISGYSTISHALAPFLCRSRRTLRILWSETNRESAGRTGRIARATKAQLIAPYDGFIVPGKRAREFVGTLRSADDAKFMYFPNLIDRSVFVDEVDRQKEKAREAIRQRFRVTDQDQLWITSARLELEKGLHRLIPQLQSIPNVKLLVAGEGSQRAALEREIREKHLPVTLLGQQSEAEIVALYAAADLFVLPSLRDPSPLAPIEACAAGLPLLVSDRMGNVDEVLSSTFSNGWLYSCSAPDDALATVRTISQLSPEELRRVGQSSRQLYLERFDTEKSVEHLAHELLRLHEEKFRTMPSP